MRTIIKNDLPSKEDIVVLIDHLKSKDTGKKSTLKYKKLALIIEIIYEIGFTIGELIEIKTSDLVYLYIDRRYPETRLLKENLGNSDPSIWKKAKGVEGRDGNLYPLPTKKIKELFKDNNVHLFYNNKGNAYDKPNLCRDFKKAQSQCKKIYTFEMIRKSKKIFINEDTARSYKTAMKQFQDGMNLSLDDIKKLQGKELSNQIDKFVKSLPISECSKLTRLSAIRSESEKIKNERLPESKIRKPLKTSKLS